MSVRTDIARMICFKQPRLHNFVVRNGTRFFPNYTMKGRCCLRHNKGAVKQFDVIASGDDS